MTKRISQPTTVIVPAAPAHAAEAQAAAAAATAAAATEGKAEVVVTDKADAPVEAAVVAVAAPAPIAMVAEAAAPAATATAAAAAQTEDGTSDEGEDATPYIVGGVLVAGGILAVALTGEDVESPAPPTTTPTPTNSAPTFTSAAAVSVAENVAAGANGAVVIDVNATDAQNNTITYTLSGADAALFTINNTTGEIRFVNSPNFEATPAKTTFNVTVTAADNGTPSLTTQQAIVITLTNVNEAPTFATSTATVTIAENLPITTVLVGTGVATDVDAGTTLRYSLTGTDAAAFAVNETTGAVTFRASPDFETRSTYTFNLVATDAATGGLTATQAVTVNVTDVAEGPPVFTSGATASVAENSAITTVVYDANANGATSFTLGGTDAALFAINATTGVVTFLASPNFETRSTYNISVTAVGPGGTVTQPVAVTVTNVNEAPVLTGVPTTAVSVPENTATTAAVFTVAATDQDAGSTLTYSLTGTDAALFAISPTGAVTFRASPDFEATPARNTLTFSVVVSDGTNTVTSAPVTVNVTDVAVEGTRIDGTGISGTTNLTYSAEPGNVTFLESGAAANVSTINNFTVGDIIQTDVATSAYSFTSNGTTLIIGLNQGGVVTRIELPNSVSANALVFNEASAEQALGFDFFRSTAAGAPAATGSLDVGTASTATTLNAGTNAFTYTETAGTASNVIVNNFSGDDRIVVTGVNGSTTATSYSFTSIDNDLIISFNNGGVVSRIQINDVVSPNALIFNEASAEQAVGFDFFRYG